VLNQLAPHSEWYSALLLDFLMSASNSSLFVTVKIKELLWGGKEYPLLKFLSTVKPGTPTEFSLQDNQTDRDAARKANNYQKDSWNTGIKNITLVGQFTKWRGVAIQDVWGSVDANTVRGTDGAGFRPHPNGPVEAFVPSSSRRNSLIKTGDVVVQGIKLLRYTLNPLNMANSTDQPAYFLNAPYGLLNLSAPMNGTPVFISKPMFMDAHESYRDAIDFLNAEIDPDLHDTHLDVEPMSGIVMNAFKRMQINVLVRGTPTLFPNLQEIFFPIIWFQESGSIGEKDAKEFKGQVYLALDIVEYGSIIFYSASGLFLVLSIVCLVTVVKKEKKTDFYEYVPGIND